MTNTATTNLKAELEALKAEAEAKLAKAGDQQAVGEVRIEFLGRKGRITGILRGLKDVPNEEKPVIGALANEIQETLTAQIEGKLAGLEEAAIGEKLQAETIDVTMPGVARPIGTVHPLTQVTGEICDIFRGMGFTVVDDQFCPEVETEHYNFEALNFPENHPARDMQDTYYTDVAGNVLLRSQTSNAQIRYMEKFAKNIDENPVRIVAPGRVYRNEEVNSRKYVMFHQLEGLLVDQDVTFSDLKGVLHEFIRHFFGGERPTRFRTSFFPFTEPSAEVDVQCIFCTGSGCPVCGQVGWLEILGAGMVDPNVLSGVNIDPETYTGFAFGMGIERLTMLKYQMNDIRLFFNGDLRFLKEFRK